ncbi:hypothetical protein L3081_00585 [Colwellia sp. MSW7]|uniref:Type II secretion system protein GspF domain-containing protein n=1 Tax=Colwellia maritima TaxID=2912588 RepID=A0ABS9WWE3_9GAMM|nr:hypothetical protein [Colwellia maritima]MCI2282166.1 hypothetical protein [Colwellia maritima]
MGTAWLNDAKLFSNTPLKHLIKPFLFLFASNSLEKLLFHNGDFKFIFIQNNKTSNEDVIHGKVFVVNSKVDLNQLIGSQEISGDFGQLIDCFNNNSLMHASIILPREGILTIDDVWFEKIDDKKLRRVTRTEGFAFNSFKDDAVSQIYYFMKDLCHQHQHHDSKSDILLPLVKGDSQESYKELTKGVLKSLYRTILKMRRTHSENDYYAMKGMMAYVSSFKEIMGKKSALRTTLCAFSTEGDKKILSSIEAKVGALRALRERKNNYTAIVPSVLSLSVASIGILFAFSSVIILSFARTEDNFAKNFKGKLPLDYVDYVIQILNHPIEIFVVLAAILLACFWIVSPHFKEHKIRADLMRLCYGFKNKYVVGLIILLSSFFMIYYAFALLDYTLVTQAIDSLKNAFFEKSITLVSNIIKGLIGLVFN